LPMQLNGKPGYEKQLKVNDRIYMVGGRIGKDGIHGATFSSEPLHEGSPATAVQIGDPITQRRMSDFLLRARDMGLFTSLTDNGAGGLSSSLGEMALSTGGATIELAHAPLKYHGLKPWEIFLSEAQERMSVAVDPQQTKAFEALAQEYQVEVTDLGYFTDSGYLTISYNAEVIASLDMEFLHDGVPQLQLEASWKAPQIEQTPHTDPIDIADELKQMVGRLNICSKEYVVRQYDHEVQGSSVVKPLCGVKGDGPSDAAVLQPVLDRSEGVVVSHGILPRYSDIDTWAMTESVVDEAVRNAVASGADPEHMAGLDNFCWCDPVTSADNPDGQYKLAQLVRSLKALQQICFAYNLPLVSGKDSMKNDYHIGDTRISIPPTLLFSLVAKIEDVKNAVTIDFKKRGNPLYITAPTYRELGSSEYAAMKGLSFTDAPRLHNPERLFTTYKKLHLAMKSQIVKAAHDCSDGGIAVAASEMAFSGELGVVVECQKIQQQGCICEAEVLFSESNGRILVEVDQNRVQEFEEIMQATDCHRIGEVVRGEMIEFVGFDGVPLSAVSRIDIKKAWQQTLAF